MDRMPPTTPSVSQSVSAVTLTVSSGSPSTTVSQTFSDSATLASLLLGTNQIQITDSALLTRFATPGLQCSNTLSLAYGGLSDVATPAGVVTKVSPKPPPGFRDSSALTSANSPVWV